MLMQPDSDSDGVTQATQAAARPPTSSAPSSSMPLLGISPGLVHKLGTRSGWYRSDPVSTMHTDTRLLPYALRCQAPVALTAGSAYCCGSSGSSGSFAAGPFRVTVKSGSHWTPGHNSRLQVDRTCDVPSLTDVHLNLLHVMWHTAQIPGICSIKDWHIAVAEAGGVTAGFCAAQN